MNENGPQSNENHRIIERWAHPTELDTVTQFTLCICADDSVWVQCAKEEEIPRWNQFESMEEALSFIESLKNHL